MESNGSSKAHEITDSLCRELEMQTKKFMKMTDDHFQMACSEESEYQKIRFVAQKSFRVGFHKGMVAVFDAMEKHRKEAYGVE